MRLLLIGVAAMLAGCASSDVVSATGGNYSVSSSAVTSFGGAGQASSKAYDKATKFCAKQDAKMVMVSNDSRGDISSSSVNVIFRCEPR